MVALPRSANHGKNHPHVLRSRSETGPDGSVNLMVWQCYVPGKPKDTAAYKRRVRQQSQARALLFDITML
ncbi:hypothetical protein HAX54_007669 [Datura stramonium]|uniref:Uncharacterized protein n=1 Tax=Datura stramonium TaxID=4076 RepID=A0ABS8TDI5_DATST|nr:hypothetical protein [Datura stramonium]